MVLLGLHVLYLFNAMCYPYTAQVRPSVDIPAKTYGGECAIYSTGNPKDHFKNLVLVFVA
jgi:hypothetical protein